MGCPLVAARGVSRGLGGAQTRGGRGVSLSPAPPTGDPPATASLQDMNGLSPLQCPRPMWVSTCLLACLGCCAGWAPSEEAGARSREWDGVGEWVVTFS